MQTVFYDLNICAGCINSELSTNYFACPQSQSIHRILEKNKSVNVNNKENYG